MKAKSLDVMLDLETCGTAPGSVILAIGACTFDLQHTFYEKISLDDSQAQGFITDNNTLAWWNTQAPAVREEAFSGTLPVVNALGNFADWYRILPAEKRFLWGNGAGFDQQLLATAYRWVGMVQPWEYKEERCYRTLKNLYFNIKADPFEGDKHNALADAQNQAIHARKILSFHFREGNAYS